MSTKSLRRAWVVIYGPEVAEGEKQNAMKIADYMRTKLNVVRVLPANAQGLELLTKLANVIIVGGSYANEWAYLLNEYVNPKAEYEISRPREPDETHYDWVRSGALTVTGLLKGEEHFDVHGGIGLICMGNQPTLRFRPLKVVMVRGWWYCDTCAMGEAFRNDAGPGIYETGCTAPTPHEEACPTGLPYKKIADP